MRRLRAVAATKAIAARAKPPCEVPLPEAAWQPPEEDVPMEPASPPPALLLLPLGGRMTFEPDEEETTLLLAPALVLAPPLV